MTIEIERGISLLVGQGTYPWHVVIVGQIRVEPNSMERVGNVTGICSHLNRVARAEIDGETKKKDFISDK